MGGSSLWPEVLSVVWRDTQVGKSGAALHVLDNTDPAAVAAVEALVAGKKTLFVVASKSGGTIEIQAFERHFWQKTLERNGGDIARAGANFVAITDPATRLGQLAEEKHYRRVFINPADIGGRYSALSYFGLVPAALVGTDVGALLASATEFAAASGAGVPVAESPAVVLGAALGAAAAAGRDKLTLVISPDIASFGSWIEQLVAESSGKEGKGIVPIDLEPVGPPESYGDDRFFVYIRSGAADAKQDAAVTALERAGQPVVRIAVDQREALGREIYRWEMATAIACASLGVNPFDEPNVTEAKVATSALLAQAAAEGKLPVPEDTCAVTDLERIRAHLATATPNDYLAFCAYFLRTPARDAALTRMRAACRDRTRNATTVGYGPRFLHSTGQLHKGGPNTGVFLQLTADTAADLPVPGEGYSFATLRDAQALGDLQVLKRRGPPRAARQPGRRHRRRPDRARGRARGRSARPRPQVSVIALPCASGSGRTIGSGPLAPRSGERVTERGLRRFPLYPRSFFFSVRLRRCSKRPMRGPRPLCCRIRCARDWPRSASPSPPRWSSSARRAISRTASCCPRSTA